MGISKEDFLAKLNEEIMTDEYIDANANSHLCTCPIETEKFKNYKLGWYNGQNQILKEMIELAQQIEDRGEARECEICKEDDFVHYQHTTKESGEVLTESYNFNFCPNCGAKIKRHDCQHEWELNKFLHASSTDEKVNITINEYKCNKCGIKRGDK